MNCSADDLIGISSRVKPVVDAAVARNQSDHQTGRFKGPTDYMENNDGHYAIRSGINAGSGLLSPLHQSAAEVVAALLVEEMKSAPGSLYSKQYD